MQRCAIIVPSRLDRRISCTVVTIRLFDDVPYSGDSFSIVNIMVAAGGIYPHV
jgi:hypothetical protein